MSGDPGRRAQREIFIPELKSRPSEQDIGNSSKHKPLHIPNLQGCKFSKVMVFKWGQGSPDSGQNSQALQVIQK